MNTDSFSFDGFRMNTFSRIDTGSGARFDEGPQDHDQRLYEPVGTASMIARLEDVDAAQIERFHEQGCLTVEQGFDGDRVRGTVDAIDDFIKGENADFEQIHFEQGAEGRVEHLTAQQRLEAVRKITDFTSCDARLHDLATDAALLDVVERIVGGRPKMIQEMALLKMPGGREKPWHQDRAYFHVAMDETVVGAWIALDEATIANGCMRVLAGANTAGPVVHFIVRDWQICDRDILEHDVRPIAVPLRPGGILFFDSYLPHGTPVNHTDQMRRALQFHYTADRAGEITQEQRLAVFGSEGKNVTC